MSLMHQQKFWEVKTLNAMTTQEWESLCDRCGRCCLHKLEDPDTDEIAFTRVACRLLDLHQCHCTNYLKRQHEVPSCINLKQDFSDYHFLPKSCAYRRLDEGRKLAAWHPLLSGDPESVHQAGISVRSKVFSEEEIDDADLSWHIVNWIDV